MTSKKLRRIYIDFFKKKGHAEIPSASLIPENDPSTLFISSGVQTIVPFLLGEKHPSGNKLVNSQKCIRTIDIEGVGNKTHLTFFEMLGHWSLGDYFKKEAIEMSYEFLTKELGLDKQRLAFSVFEGDESAPRDEEAADVWKSLGVPEARIAYLNKAENWWELAGSGGPCGPDTEMYYWVDDNEPAPEKFDPQDERWVEIGNDVLMQYEKQGENKYIPAKQKNIDNGTGFERLLSIMNGVDDVFKTDLFEDIIKDIEKLSDKKYGEDEEVTKSMRIIADHIRSAVFIMVDETGIVPSNVDQGYVVRKLIRRAIRHGRMIGIQDNFTDKIGKVVIKIMKDVYVELEKNKKFVLDNLELEEEKFTKTLQQGLKEFGKIIETKKQKNKKTLSGKESFDLFQTYGFPLELTQELAKENSMSVDEDGFNKEMEKHQELSRTASAGKFKGGLADQSEQVIKYHTTTHLLHAALKQILGDHVQQKGSNINEERLRFDFSHTEKMTPEQIKEVEKIVNEKISDNLPVCCEEMTLEQAQAKGATGLFADKYGEKVKVYSIGESGKECSTEICGGPHVDNTGKLGKFKIKKEESSSAGVRRIKAVLED